MSTDRSTRLAREWLSAQNCEFGREPTQRHEAVASLAALLDAERLQGQAEAATGVEAVVEAARQARKIASLPMLKDSPNYQAYIAALAGLWVAVDALTKETP